MSHLAQGHFSDAALHQRKENDTPTKIDAYVLEHIHPPSHPTSESLRNVLHNSKENGLPDIEASPTFAKFMALQCMSLRVRHVLEVGTLGGSTAIWIALINPGIHVTTIEVDAKHAEVARRNCADAGVSDRIEILEGTGLDVISILEKDIASGQREKFGYVFIDADKQNNWKYFDAAVRICYSGASIVVDNVVRRGNLVNPDMLKDERVAGSREVIEKAGKDGRVEATVMQTVGEKSYDGFLYAVVK